MSIFDTIDNENIIGRIEEVENGIKYANESIDNLMDTVNSLSQELYTLKQEVQSIKNKSANHATRTQAEYNEITKKITRYCDYADSIGYTFDGKVRTNEFGRLAMWLEMNGESFEQSNGNKMIFSNYVKNRYRLVCKNSRFAQPETNTSLFDEEDVA